MYVSIKSHKEALLQTISKIPGHLFSCNSINKSCDKTAYLKHLSGDFYSAQSVLGTQMITFPHTMV